MKLWILTTVLSLSLGVMLPPALAVDHDNVDANRPLEFDDAETIAFQEKTLEWGGALAKPRSGKSGLEGEAEFLYGFAKNWHLNVGLHPSFTAEGGGKRRGNIGDLSLGVQHNFNRETERAPALGLRVDTAIPAGRDSRGLDFRLRGIASRQWGRYGRLHLNGDLNINNRAAPSERNLAPGVILGYSVPLGFPTRFDRTLLAQVGYRVNPERDQRGLIKLGIGLRQQVTPRSVLDLGLLSDIAGSGAEREKFRLVAGYSTAF